MIATNLIPAVTYLRRSTDRQEQSLGDQRREVARYADENGYHIVREYMDDAISGTSADARPAFQRMIADAKDRGFRAVLVWASDRFSRGDVTETEHYRYLLRASGTTVVSVTENYLNREGIDADVLRTVKQFQNRQFSISLSQNTLRGQISSVKGESDPGRLPPYGYDREVLGPDGSVLHRIRYCEGGIREVYGKDGGLQARYTKGQSLRKPGKECKARLVLSNPERAQVVKDIFRLCLEGRGFKGIAEVLNARGVLSPKGDLWGFSTIKAILENPVYRGDIVWNRRTSSKFYTVHGGRAESARPADQSGKVVDLPEDEWLVIRDKVPPLIGRDAWQGAQAMVTRRSHFKGGVGKERNRWLLSGVLRCGDCGHLYWGEARRKGRIEGRKDVVTKYYACAGRRSHGRQICPVSSSIPAEALERWVLDKLACLVFTDRKGVEAAVDGFVATVLGQRVPHRDTPGLAQQIKEVEATLRAITANIDPANLSLLNDRLTQLRQRKESLERELAAGGAPGGRVDEAALRQWALERIGGLADAMNGRRDETVRNVLASYVGAIKVTPSTKSGVMLINAEARHLPKQNDRPEGRSWVNVVAGAGFVAIHNLFLPLLRRVWALSRKGRHFQTT